MGLVDDRSQDAVNNYAWLLIIKMVTGYILYKLDVSVFRVRKDKVVVKSGSHSSCNFHFSLSPSLFFHFGYFSFLFRHFCKLAANDCYLCYISLFQNMEKLIPTKQVFMSLSTGAVALLWFKERKSYEQGVRQ